MATIRERNSRYTAIIRKAGYSPVTKTFSSRRNAEQWARRIESSIEQGEVVETARHTLADAIERYQNEAGRHVFRNANGSAPFKYRDNWVVAVTAAKVDDFRVHDLRHVAASTLAMAGKGLGKTLLRISNED